MRLRERLLSSLHDERSFEPPPILSATTTKTTASWSQKQPAEIIADMQQMLNEMPRRRIGSGGSYGGMPIEIDPRMPEGWFGLREPGKPRYAGPLPLSSIDIFHREGDVVSLGPGTMRRLIREADANSVDAALPSPPSPG